MKTKNSLIFALALILISSTTFAQINFGMRHGVAGTTFSGTGDIYDNANITYSYTAGAFFTIPVIESLAIQPEINYVRKGRSNETTELDTPFETDFMIQYIQVPVLLQYRNNEILSNSGSVFYINAGPYTGFALNPQTRESGNSEDLIIMTDTETQNDWGATFGLGFQTPIRHNEVRFDLRYDMGFSEIKSQPDDYHTKALSLTIGILL
jgi:hypothetical protein